jgi:hypothetical protein
MFVVLAFNVFDMVMVATECTPQENISNGNYCLVLDGKILIIGTGNIGEV